MEIEILKDPFEYRRFKHQIIFDKDILSNDDANILGRKVCAKLNEITNMGWKVETCVGNKCIIKTRLIPKKSQRVSWKGKIITISDIPNIK